MLEGSHRKDVIEDIQEMFGIEVASELSIAPDLSRNVFANVWRQLNVLYDEPPTVSFDGSDEDTDISTVIVPQLWPVQQQRQFLTLGAGEALLRLDWHSAGHIVVRTAPSDLVVAMAGDEDGDRPLLVAEARPRFRGPAVGRDHGEVVWTWETWDVRDPGAPRFAIETADDKGKPRDATEEFLPADKLDRGWPLGYRDRSGAPVLPYVLYHKDVGTTLWSWERGTELARGALRLASLWTHWCDGFSNAAYPQRWVLDVKPPAGHAKQIGGVSVDVIPTERKAILRFLSEQGRGSRGQWSPSMEPLAAADALLRYEQGLAVYADLSPSDLQITQGQSGYSIVVQREGQRRAQRRQKPSARLGDQLFFSAAARLSNANAGTDFPEEPAAWRIEYTEIGESLEERKAERDEIGDLMDRGLMDPIEAMRRLHPEMASDEEAEAALIRIRARRAAMEQAVAVLTADGGVGAEIPATNGARPGTVADLALNGAQVSSMLELLSFVGQGYISKEQAKTMILVAFPTVEPTEANKLVDSAPVIAAPPTKLRPPAN